MQIMTTAHGPGLMNTHKAGLFMQNSIAAAPSTTPITRSLTHTDDEFEQMKNQINAMGFQMQSLCDSMAMFDTTMPEQNFHTCKILRDNGGLDAQRYRRSEIAITKRSPRRV